MKGQNEENYELEKNTTSYLHNTFSWIDDAQRFAGSSCPGLNSPMQTDGEFLRTRVDGIVSLNDAELDWSPLTILGIKQISVNVRDYQPPSIEQMEQIVEFITHLGTDASVLVHCNAGMGRTGTVLASLLVWRNGLSADDAIRQVRTLRRGSVQTYKQEDGVRAWAAHLHCIRPVST